MSTSINFKILKKSNTTKARRGTITLPHGTIETPAFMPVGTLGTVKSLTPSDLTDLGVEIIVANTYHLYLQPGEKVLEQYGGLHRFMGWNNPILTDSGGFQVFSLGLGKLKSGKNTKESMLAYKIEEEGVWFKSHIDGSSHHLTPEKSIKIQEIIGADILLAFDECPPAGCGKEYTAKAMNLTHRWATRCLEAKKRADQALFGIVQGGIYPDLREKSASHIASLPFDGYSIGGLAVGEEKNDMYAMLDVVNQSLPEDKPRHLLGVGTPEDLIQGIRHGIDLFDCVLPTRLGRNGAVFTPEGRLNLRNAKNKSDESPIDVTCSCYCCSNFSKAYLHHLFKAKEMLGAQLASMHNIAYLLEVVRKEREAI
jgi:queuine tRNA-ribosyltransferase